MEQTDLKIREGVFLVLLSILLLIASWACLSLIFPPLVVPSPIIVFKKLLFLISKKEFFTIIGTTIMRLILGLIVGISIGTIVGILLGFSKKIHTLLSPWIIMLQAVPPVCWLVLALVWFGFNGKPSIFIVSTATIPPMVNNIRSGIVSIDRQLLEMARLYRFSKKKILFNVILPSLRPYFEASFEIVITGGWKLAVMGEVLTTSSGIGGEIANARLNIEPETILAWAILLILFSYLTSLTLRMLSRKGRCYHAAA